MPDAPEDDRPQIGPPSTMRQFRLTALERADVSRALMTRITAIGAGDAHDDQEGYRLRQLLERFTG